MAVGNVLVVGGSLAGLRAVQALREAGHAGPLTVVGGERHWPYNRPPLSKAVLDGDDDVALSGAEDLDVRWLLGRQATHLDLRARVVNVDNGDELGFDGLVITTGGRPRTLTGRPEKIAGVHSLRTIDDALALRRVLDAGPRRLVIVGAGFIGGEVASTARAKGVPVTLVDAASAPMRREVGDQVARWIARHHERNGVELICGHRVVAVEGHNEVDGVRLDDGRLVPADAVVFGTGVVPNTEWLQGSGLELDRGVVTDAKLFASGLPWITAAGDVVRWRHELYDGALVANPHWANANEQGAAAARNLLSGPANAEPYTAVPTTSTYVHGARIQSAGLPWLADESWIVAGAAEEKRLVVAFGRAGVLVGAAAVNGHKHVIRLRRGIAARMATADAAGLIDPDN